MRKSYPEYRDSGVEWLGEVPAHWKVTKLRHVAAVEGGSTPKTTVAEYWDGDISWITPNDLGSLSGTFVTETERSISEEGLANCGATLTPPGSVVVSTRAPIGHMAVTTGETCTNQGCKTVVPMSGQADSQFVYYVLLSGRDELKAMGRGSTFMELPSQEMKGVKIPLPPLDEQRTLATYLDRKTQQIDTLIAKKQRLIELLREQRTAVINRAVTKGLDPAAPMKDSGIEWLGEVPAHWGTGKLRYVTNLIQTGPFGSQLHADEYIEGGTPVVNPSNIVDGTLKQDKTKTISTEVLERLKRHRLNAGDIVFARRGEMGRCALVTESEDGWLCGTGSIKVVLEKSEVDPEYLSLSLSTEGIAEWLSLESVGSTMSNLNTDILSSIPIPIPPKDEQGRIVDAVTEKSTGIDRVIRRESLLVEKLQELRTALISEVVTGKIDVRGEAATEQDAAEAPPVAAAEEVAA